jgi:AraC-like DNA-binding protein
LLRKIPSLERILADPEQSFRCQLHDFPCDIARWNYHPEHEIHLIRQSTGHVFVGDYIGAFAPGHFALVSSNVPHNWVSDLGPGEVVADRDLVIQFDPSLLRSASDLFPELRQLFSVADVFDRSWEFTGGAARTGARLMEDIHAATGVPRLVKFMQLVHLLATTAERVPLTAPDYVPHVDEQAAELIEKAINMILSSLPNGITLAEIASNMGMSQTAFSRFFKRNVGHTFVSYVRKLRISDACRLLAETERPITEICFEVGYANISNFNRSFLDERGITPSTYRRLARSPGASTMPSAPAPQYL